MKLNRANYSAAKAPERIVHIGVGSFAKAHQIWYTQQVDDNNEWGVVAFTGRSSEAAEKLTEQDGLYNLVTRSADGDSYEVIDRIVRAEDINKFAELNSTISNPAIAVVTLTITEAGYSSPIIELIADALDARRTANAGPIALVPCDNMPNNGEVLRLAITKVFSDKEWLRKSVSFVSTSVDRITPKTTEADIVTGWEDNSVTVTEPFSSWILSGEFPAGRPAWENSGAKFVSEIEPFERRKLWLLNGAHSILAYTGIERGHSTVAEAIADEYCLDLVNDFWNDAVCHLPADGLDLHLYRQALLKRFSNPRIAHQLRQIAMDGATKLAVRIAPVALAELAAGRSAIAEAKAIAAWVGYLQANDFQDSRAEAVRLALAAPEPVSALIGLLDANLSGYGEFVEKVGSNAKTTIK